MIWLVMIVMVSVVVLTVRQYRIRSKKMAEIDSAASMLRNDVLEIQRLAASVTQPKIDKPLYLLADGDDSYSVAAHDARTAVENVLRFSQPTEYFREFSVKDLNANISLICDSHILSEYYAELLEDASYTARKDSVSVVDDDFWDAAFWSVDRSHRGRGFIRQGGKRKTSRSFEHGENNLGGYVFG